LMLQPSPAVSTFFFSTFAHPRDLHSFLHDALPISQFPRASQPHFGRQRDRLDEAAAEDGPGARGGRRGGRVAPPPTQSVHLERKDRKSTRLNSSHSQISYAVFCLKKKNKNN